MSVKAYLILYIIDCAFVRFLVVVIVFSFLPSTVSDYP